MADFNENLISKEETKGDSENNRFSNGVGLLTSVPNTTFDMSEKTLTSLAIKPKDLRAKIEEYLNSEGLTKDQLKLLLKQGAEDNHLFMIKEATYDKLVNVLGVKTDHDADLNLSNISGLLATARSKKNSLMKTQSNQFLEASANRFAILMKSRSILRDKSAVNKFEKFVRPQFKSSKLETSQSINECSEDDEEQNPQPSPKLPVPKVEDPAALIAAHETSPDLLERVPRITNQGLKNNMIVAGIFFISL
jgi:hypothetical protein